MGPTLAVLARRAAEKAGHKLEILAVSRFANLRAKDWLENHGVGTATCDLLDRQAVSRLPATENLLYLVGLKFGTAQSPAQTWAANTLVPAHVAEHYSAARIVALSTGNVYPFSPVAQDKFVHTVAAGYVTGSIFVLAVSAYYLLRRKHADLARRSMTAIAKQ